MADRSYRAAPPDALRVEPLGELTAIFDRRSMQTHLVVAPMPEILDAMGAEICNATKLAARLAAAFDFDSAGRRAADPCRAARRTGGDGLVERA